VGVDIAKHKQVARAQDYRVIQFWKAHTFLIHLRDLKALFDRLIIKGACHCPKYVETYRQTTGGDRHFY